MTSNYTFRGQVKVSDVQAAFDDFLNRINTMVSTFNATETAISSIDLTVGGPTLAAGGYCLTVGGIKQLLNAYDGCLIGCRAFRIDSNHIAVTDGMYITKEKPIRIHSQVLTGNGFDIYFNPSDATIGLVNNDTMPEGAVIIEELSNVSSDTYLTEYRGVQLEGLEGYKITIQKRALRWGIDGDDTSKHRFHGAGVFQVNSAGADRILYAGSPYVPSQGWAANHTGRPRAKRAHASALPCNFLFIPKGQTSPLQPEGGNHTSRTHYDFTLEKPSS